jgi:hypothetical protein
MRKEDPGVAKSLKKYGKDLESLILSGGTRQYRVREAGNELQRFTQGIEESIEAFMEDHGGSLLKGTYHQYDGKKSGRQLIWTAQGRVDSETVNVFVLFAEPGRMFGGSEGLAVTLEARNRETLAREE